MKFSLLRLLVVFTSFFIRGTLVAADVATPILQLLAPENATEWDVQVSCATSGAVLRYTVNGREPTIADPSIAIGDSIVVDHNLVLKVKAWDGNTPATLSPSAVAAGVYNLIGKVVAGANESFAVMWDGRISGAGYNATGQLANGTTDAALYPVWARQNSSLGQLVRTAVSLSTSHETGRFVVMAARDGTAWAWGENGSGQIGDGTTTTRPFPVQVLTAAGQPLTGIIAVAAGKSKAFALRADGKVYGWGSGYGTYAVAVKTTAGIDLTNVVAMACGSDAVTGVDHFLALKDDGTVWTCGSGLQTTHGSDVSQVKASASTNLTDVVSIGAGGGAGYVVKADGTAWSWGYNGYGQLGDGSVTTRTYPVQVKTNSTTFLTGAKEVAGGYRNLYVLKSDGTLWSSGTGAGIGYGSSGQQNYVVQVKKDASNFLTNVVSVSGGSQHAVALDNTGKVFGWGYEGLGQLGNGAGTTVLYATAGAGWKKQAYAPTALTLTATVTDSSAGDIRLVATLVDPDSEIARVDFYQGGTPLGSATASPWGLVLSGATTSEAFTAIAYSGAGWAGDPASANAMLAPPVILPKTL